MPENEPVDVTAMFRWPAAVAEEMMRFPETMRTMREMMTEQARLMRNLNESAEIFIRMAKRWEESDMGQALGTFGPFMPRFDEPGSSVRSPDAAARLNRLETTLEEIRDRWNRNALRAFEAFMPRPPQSSQPEAPATHSDPPLPPASGEPSPERD